MKDMIFCGIYMLMDKLLEEITRNRELMSLHEQSIEDSAKEFIKNIIAKYGPDAKEKSEDELVSTYGRIKHKYSGEQGRNVDLIIDEMEKSGIKDPLTQVGILSVIAKESGFNAFKEKSYCNTSNSRIRQIFGRRTKRYSDEQLNQLKCNDPQFFEAMYGKGSGIRLGNTQPGDGWRYVGRGFNGLTGRGNYKKYGNMIGVNLEGNPELVEDPRVAAKIAIAFFTKGKDPKSMPKFSTEEEAAKYFANLNAGSVSTSSQSNAIAKLDNFDIVA
jgi:predicted chitinase